MKKLLSLLIICTVLSAKAQFPDPSFNNTGILYPDANFDYNQQSGFAIAIAEQADGKILALMRQNRLWRFNADGSVDTTFGASGYIQPFYGFMNASGSNNIMNIFVMPDQKILVVSHNIAFFFFRRFNSDGSVDETYAPDGLKTVNFTYPNLLGIMPTLQPILTPDQKILFVVTGLLNIPSSPTNIYSYMTIIGKFSVDGTPDLSFNGSGFAVCPKSSDSFAYAANRIYVQGQYLSCFNYLTGALDPAFGDNGVLNMYAMGLYNMKKIIPFDDGSIWLHLEGYGPMYTPILKRLTANQQIDNAFGINGTVTLDLYVAAIAKLNNGKILMAGTKGVYNYKDCVVERFNPNGTVDVNGTTPAKYTVGLGPYGASPASCITVANDGKYLIGGGSLVYNPGSSFPPYGPVIWRLLPEPLPLGTDDVQSQEFVCYPNPVAQKINIRYKGNNMPENFRLCDLNGRIVKYFSKSEIVSSAQTLQLDAPGQMTTGNYILLFTTAGTEHQVRIAKQ